MYGVFDVSTSALTAQRMRLDVIAANIAMKDTVHFENGEPVPYRRHVALLAPAEVSGGGRAGSSTGGVRVAAIVEDPSPFPMRWAPDDPMAYRSGPKKGYVPRSNVDYTTEMVDAMAAQRAYEANVSVIEMFKSMAANSLRLIA